MVHIAGSHDKVIELHNPYIDWHQIPKRRQIEWAIEVNERAERESAELYGASIIALRRTTVFLIYVIRPWHALCIP